MYFHQLPIVITRQLFRLPLPALILLLTACGGMSVEPDSAEQAKQARQQAIALRVVQQRQLKLTQLKNWELNGRISLVTEDEAWSGQLYWQQSGSRYLIQFNAPSGQGAMQLLSDGESVELRLANGDSYQAKDADSLLRQETTWDLPVKGLWFWIRGLPDPELTHKAQLNSQGLIGELVQDHWQVRYDRYQQYDNHYFPRKIVIQKDDTKVRLIVTNWVVS